MKTLTAEERQGLFEQYLEAARAVAGAIGPLLAASDEPDDILGQAAAHANFELLLPGWCRCGSPNGAAYFRNNETGYHGWLCRSCLRMTQAG